MVNLEDIKDISTPMTDVLKFLILDRRVYVIEAFQSYEKHAVGGKRLSTNVIRSGLIALFREIAPSLKRDLLKLKLEDEYKEIERGVFSNNYETLCIVFNKLNEWLYTKSVTKFDTTERYDKTRTSIEDRQKGL